MSSRIKIRIRGRNPQIIVNEIIKRKINIYRMIQKKQEIDLIVDEQDYKIIKEIKTTYQIKIVEWYGISKWKRILKKHKFFLLLIILGFFINLFLSNIIFSIDIIHSNERLKERILNDLEEAGIKKYHFVVSNRKKEQIKRMILEKEKNDIEWLEIERIGTKYVIKLEQRKERKEEVECLPRDIVAKKNATILEIKGEEGEILVKKNDYVTKNQVLISGLIHNKEEVMAKRCAKGVIYGEVWYKVQVSIPKYKKKKILGKEKSYSMNLTLGKKNYELFKNKDKQTISQYNIIESKLIPFQLSIHKNQKVQEEKILYEDKELEILAFHKVEESFQKKLQDEEMILEKKVLKKSEKNSKIIIEVFLNVKENITDTKELKEEIIEETE